MPPLRFFSFTPCRHASRLAAVLLGSLLFLQDAGAAPRLTEFLAENQEGPKDEDGESSDYLEIHNPDAEPYNLSGCRLTDRASETSRWVFPTVVLQPGARLLVWASGKTGRTPKRRSIPISGSKNPAAIWRCFPRQVRCP